MAFFAIILSFAILGAAQSHEGEFCGGITGTQCATGLVCRLQGNFPDAGGTCFRCGGILGVQCPKGQTCHLEGDFPDAAGLCEAARTGAGEGEFCGGIAALPCAEGLICQLDGNFPDAGGHCVRPGAGEGEFCGGIAGIQCVDGLVCRLDGNFPDAGGHCFRCGGILGVQCPRGQTCHLEGDFPDAAGTCEPVVCIALARECPDGSYTSPDPANGCAFRPCPTGCDPDNNSTCASTQRCNPICTLRNGSKFYQCQPRGVVTRPGTQPCSQGCTSCPGNQKCNPYCVSSQGYLTYRCQNKNAQIRESPFPTC